MYSGKTTLCYQIESAVLQRVLHSFLLKPLDVLKNLLLSLAD